MTTKTAELDKARDEQPTPGHSAPRWTRPLRLVLSERVALLSVLLVVVVVWFWYLGQNDYLVAPYDADYLASALETMVPLCLLGLAEFIVIVSGLMCAVPFASTEHVPDIMDPTGMRIVKVTSSAVMVPENVPRIMFGIPEKLMLPLTLEPFCVSCHVIVPMAAWPIIPPAP